jgi:signal transduction histidine kinase/AcrR family transcriptional regulator
MSAHPNREAIIAAGWVIYGERGLAAVTLENVAQHLDVAEAAVVACFASTVALTQDMIVEAALGPVAAVVAGVEAAPTGAAALDQLLRQFTQYYIERDDHFRMVHASSQTDPAAVGMNIDMMRTRVLPFLSPMLAVTESKIVEEWGESELPHGIHPRRLAYFAQSAAIGFLTVRSMMTAMGTTLAHSDEHSLLEMSQALASGPRVLRQLSALNDVSKELAALRHEEQVVARTPALLASALDLSRVAMFLRRSGDLRLVSAAPSSDTLVSVAEELSTLAGLGSDDTVYLPTRDSAVGWQGPLVITPIHVGGEYAGALVGQATGDSLDQRDISRVEMFSNMTGLALESVRLYESLHNLVDERTHRLRQAQELVAGIAHELNTPLGAIRSAQDSLRTMVTRQEGRLAEDDDRAKKGLRRMRDMCDVTSDASGRVEHTVARLKSFVRLDQAEHQLVDVHECIEDALSLIEHRIGEGVEVTRSFSQVPRLRCSPAQLNQLFLNLLDNARHAIGDKGTISLETLERGDFVHVVIADDGSGIAEANIGRVFDPGYTTRGVGVGTGLGLSISLQIARQHGGDIQIESRLGGGTRVNVSLEVRGQPR